MSEDRLLEHPDPRHTRPSEEEAERRFQALTGMSAEAARVWVAYSSGLRGRPARP